MSTLTAPPHAPNLCGRALNGRYELHALIGEGAFGRVYRGLDRRLARRVAVKVIKPWWAEDPEWRRSFELEAQLLARVSDPGIVQIFDVGHDREGLYYVAELVDGESLEARLRRGRLSPGEARNLAEQLCRALGHAHARGVVHRDVKPANVLISAQGILKVGDFGVARFADASSDAFAATIVGTPKYMAPEQARGRGTSAATDVYSVGVVLYEMLAGRAPFSADSPVELALCHLQDAPAPLPASVPRALKRIVTRALSKDPRQRYADGAAMADALARGRGSSATAGGAHARPRRRPDTPGPDTPGPDTPGPDGSRLDGSRVDSSRPDGARPDATGPGTKTRVAPRMSERRNVNPPARRRTIALFTAVTALIAGMIAATFVLGHTRHELVPRLHGLSKAAVERTLRRDHLRPSFGSRYSSARRGTAIQQRPAPGARLAEGSSVRVLLSAGPPPVAVPRVVGISAADARTALGRIGLNVSTEQVPAPGVSPGLVVGQTPSAGAELFPKDTVALRVAETPQWRTLTTFTGARSSVPFTIRGTQWRIVYRMSYQGMCTFVLFCSGPSAQVADLARGTTASSFDLGDGSGQIRTFQSRPGLYQIKIAPGPDTATWSVDVQDYY